MFIQGRKSVQKVLKDLLKQRASGPQSQNQNLLDIVVEELNGGKALVDEEFMIDLVAGLIFAGISFAPTLVTLSMRFLTKNPKVVEALMVSTTSF